MLNTVLAVDIGTSSLKAGLFTADGEDVFVYRQKYGSPESRFIGQKWFHYLELAMEKIHAALQSKKIKDEINIIAISVSGNGPTLVCQNGLTFKWNEDISPQVEELIKEANSNGDRDNCNCLNPFAEASKSLFIPRILTLKETFPEDYNESDFIFSGPEYLIYQLTDTPVTILPEERYTTAYWTSDLLERCGIDSRKFPGFKTVGSEFGKLSESAAKILNLTPGISVYGAGPDFIAALIGTGTTRPGVLCDRSGSSEGINFCIEKPVYAPGIRTLPSVISGLWNISVLIPQSSRLPEDERLEKVVEAINLLKKLCKENEIEFPDYMKVTGGQTANKIYLQKKANKLGLRLVISKCKHAELLGDSKIVWLKNENL